MGGNSDALDTLKVTEDQIKAVFLYNFASFVRLPAGAFQTPNSPMVYCVAEDLEMAEILESVVEGEVVKGHRLIVKPIAIPDQVYDCHVLYVGTHENPSVSRYLQVAAKRDILTVSDDERFVNHGGMISLARRGKRIRPLINMAVVGRSKITVSAKLLGLAILVGTQED